MKVFPFFQKIEGKTFLIVGGGRVAAEKVGRLVPFGASMHVVGTWISEEIRQLAAEQAALAESFAPGTEEEPERAVIRIEERPFAECDLEEAAYCIAATDDDALNRRIHDLCVERKIPVNVVDTMELCEFIFPSLIKKGDLTVAISTAGKSPAMARHLKKQIEAVLPEHLEAMLDRLGELRKTMPERIATQKQRGRAYKEIMERLLATENTASEEEVEAILRKYAST